LMFPMWLAVYATAGDSRSRFVRPAATLCVWLLALAPYAWMPVRPLRDWPGTAGLTKQQLDLVRMSTASKAVLASAYLSTGSWQAAQAAAPQPVYPDPSLSRFDDKLRFLRDHRLSFFSGDPARCDYLPWLGDAGALNRL